MNRSFPLASFAAAAVLTFALAGCTQPAPPDTREVDAKALRDLESANQKDWAAKDAAKIANFYADDAVLYMQNAPPLNGKSAIQGMLSETLKDPGMTLSYETGKAEASKGGDMGYTEGTYTMTFTGRRSPQGRRSQTKRKNILTEKGKYVTVFKKQPDGSWKAVADIVNANAPAAPAK